MLETLYIGQNTIRLSSVDSTNNYTANLLNETFLPEGTVILADEQTKGRGQRGKEWVSEKGKNLMATFILYPKFLQPVNQFYLNFMVAVSLKESVERILPSADVKIKWPNDIFINGKKAAGILIENTIGTSQVKSSLIGIGLNCNQRFFGSLDATSLANEISGELNLQEVLHILYKRLELNYESLRNGKGNFNDKFNQALYGKNRLVAISLYSEKLKIHSVNEKGQMIFEREGEKQAFNHGEVEIDYSEITR